MDIHYTATPNWLLFTRHSHSHCRCGHNCRENSFLKFVETPLPFSIAFDWMDVFNAIPCNIVMDFFHPPTPSFSHFAFFSLNNLWIIAFVLSIYNSIVRSLIFVSFRSLFSFAFCTYAITDWFAWPKYLELYSSRRSCIFEATVNTEKLGKTIRQSIGRWKWRTTNTFRRRREGNRSQAEGRQTILSNQVRNRGATSAMDFFSFNFFYLYFNQIGPSWSTFRANHIWNNRIQW